MALDSNTLDSQQDLATFLRQQSARIVSEWEGAARKLDSAAHLPRPQLVNFIPGLLQHIAELAENAVATHGSELSAEASERHALDRLEDGFDLNEVVTELSMLRDCILRLWSQSDRREPGVIAGQRMLNQALDKAIITSVNRYTEARERTLRVLDRISSTALEAASLDELLSHLVGAFAEEMSAVDTVAILLCEGDNVKIRAAIGLPDSPGFASRIGEGFAGTIAATRQPIQLRAAATDPLVKDDRIRARGIQALYGVPLIHSGELIGVAHMGSATAYEFSREDLILFGSMTTHATAGIRQHMLRDRVNRRAQELAESERKFRVTFENAAAGIAQVGLDGRWLRLNAKYCEILGYPEEDLTKLTIEDVTYADDAEQERANRDRLIRGEIQEYALEKRYVRKNGRIVWVELFASLVHDAYGDPAYLVTVVQDTTAQRALREQLEFLSRAGNILGSTLNLDKTLDDLARLAVSAIADWCSVEIADPDHQYRDLVAIAHRDPAQIDLVKEVRRRYPRRSDAQGGAGEVLRTGQPLLVREVDAELLREFATDDTHFEFLQRLNLRSLLIVPLLQQGRAIGTMALATAESGRTLDASDLALAQELARRASVAIENARLHDESERAVRLREQILAIVSHDLRNPIGTIDLASNLLQTNQSIRSDASARRQVEAIERSAGRATRLIDDLLDVASMQAGTLALELSTCELRSVLCEAVESYEPLAQEKHMHLRWELPVEGRYVLCDHDRLVQVLSNLIGNAIKFCSPGDSITLRAEARERDAQVSLVDTGPGIAADEVAHIFDVYWKGRGGERGTGLGLFISKGIIESHGGRIWVESQLGQGSTFSFTLPLSPPPTSPDS